MSANDGQLPPSDLAAFQRTEERYRTFRTAIRTIGWIAAAYVFYLCVRALAGRLTDVSVAVSVLADIKFAIAVTVTLGSVGWAVVERSLRHRKVEKMQGRIRELELAIDPGRTTSGLTPQGKTHPRDRHR